MKIAITADSVVDLSRELCEKYDIKIIPLNIILGDNEYKEGEISQDEIFEFVSKTGKLPKTSALNSAGFVGYFTEILKEYDKIIHFDISSEMSVTYSNALVASQEFDGKVEVIDSRTLSTGMALQAIYARELTATISDIKEIADKVRARADSVQASFVIERLDYLHKGGRCSAAAKFGANLLRLRPQIIVKEGKMGSYKTYRGSMDRCVKNYCEDTLAEFNTYDKHVAFITYSSATEEMIKIAREALENAGFENIYESRAGATVCSHCGPNTLGILYYNDAK